MNTLYIKTGDKVEITVKHMQDEDLIFTTSVEKVIDDNHIQVQAPIHCGKLVKFNFDSSYPALFITDKGIINHNAFPVEHLKADGFNYLIFRIVPDGIRRQRREHFRFTCDLPFKFSEFGNDSVDDNVEELSGLIRDISAGGIRFDSNAEISLASEIKVEVILNDILFVSTGKILYKRHISDSPYKYEYRIIFINILDDEKDKIMQFVFNEQRNTLKVKSKS